MKSIVAIKLPSAFGSFQKKKSSAAAPYYGLAVSGSKRVIRRKIEQVLGICIELPLISHRPL